MVLKGLPFHYAYVLPPLEKDENVMTLFDEISTGRNASRPSGHSEPRFTYLNGSGRQSMIKIRDVLEQWFSRVEGAEKKELLPRFRSSDDSEHIAAFFELYTHELLCRMNYKVEFHPKLMNGSNKRPDFLVSSQDNHPLFYLECTTVCPASMLSSASRLNALYDTLSRLVSPDFTLLLTINGSSRTTPPGVSFRKTIQRWLKTLDPDESLHELELHGYDAMPKLPFQHEGLYMVVTAVPKAKEFRGESESSAIGGYVSGSSCTITTSVDVKSALIKKANYYGKMTLPYIVAINDWNSMFSKQEHALEALFGEEVFVLSPNDTGKSTVSCSRKPNGAWRGPDGWRMKNVSAALIAVGLDEFYMNKRSPCLYHHPCPTNVLRKDMWMLPQYFIDGEISGKKASAILDIPEEWPSDDQ